MLIAAGWGRVQVTNLLFEAGADLGQAHDVLQEQPHLEGALRRVLRKRHVLTHVLLIGCPVVACGSTNLSLACSPSSSCSSTGPLQGSRG